MKNFKTCLVDLYLDWVNNFLSIDGFAAYYCIGIDDAKTLIDLGRKFHEERIKEKI